MPGPAPVQPLQLRLQVLQLSRLENSAQRYLHGLTIDLFLGLGSDITFMVKSFRVALFKGTATASVLWDLPTLCPGSFPSWLLTTF